MGAISTQRMLRYYLNWTLSWIGAPFLVELLRNYSEHVKVINQTETFVALDMRLLDPGIYCIYPLFQSYNSQNRSKLVGIMTQIGTKNAFL